MRWRGWPLAALRGGARRRAGRARGLGTQGARAGLGAGRRCRRPAAVAGAGARGGAAGEAGGGAGARRVRGLQGRQRGLGGGGAGGGGRIRNATALVRRQLGSVPPRALPAPPAGGHAVPARAAHPARRGRAARSTVERGAARLWLGLDRRLRMGEGSASGGALGRKPREGRWWKTGGGCQGNRVYNVSTDQGTRPESAVRENDQRDPVCSLVYRAVSRDGVSHRTTTR